MRVCMSKEKSKSTSNAFKSYDGDSNEKKNVEQITIFQ